MIEDLEGRLLMAVFTVTTAADDGPGSLRQAILDANASPGGDGILFNIPGAGVHTIKPLSPLPALTGLTTLDGRTQPGATTRPTIELDGSSAGDLADGIVLSTTSGGSTVRGLVINRFGRHGILSQARDMNRFEFNYIGTDALGQTDLGNGGSGLVVQGAAGVGGISTAQENLGNLISGNEFAGVWVNAPATASVYVFANLIGTDASGSRAIGNGRDGVLVEGGAAKFGRDNGNLATLTTRNVISGNGGSGIRLSGAAASGTATNLATIDGNMIGVDVTGFRAVPNGTNDASPYRDGITIEGAANIRIGADRTGSRNVISGNVGAGVFIRSAGGPVIQGNYIGTDVTGNADLGNGGDGVLVVTATGPQAFRAQGNVISGNGGDGIHLESNGDLAGQLMVIGNNIGTNTSGTGALANDGDGVEFRGSAQGIIGGPTFVRGTAGAAPQPLSPATAGGNLISANGGSGVVLDATSPVNLNVNLNVTVQGNRIGTDVTGNYGLGNAGDGVRVTRVITAGGTVVTGNLVSANGGDGISVTNSRGVAGRTSNNPIGGNFIGTNGDGNAPLGNGGNGVALRSSTSIGVGGKTRSGTPVVPGPVNPAGTGRNVISGNAGHGILIAGSVGTPNISTGHYIADNFIGTDVTGALRVGNGGSGIFVSGGAHLIGDSGLGNVLSANAVDGITLVGVPAGQGQQTSTGQNRIQFNKIGTDAAGSDAASNLGNGGRGIAVYNSANNVIGADAATPATVNAGNIIAFNAGSGVAVEGGPAASNSAVGPADGNLISRNSIFSNGGLGIDLVNGYEGVTPNDPRDPDLGPNRLQNFPVVTLATATSPTTTTVRLTLNSEPSRTYRIDFYSSPEPDPSGYGEGKTYLGSMQVATDGTGNGVNSSILPAGTTPGSYVTATATTIGGTSGIGNTSEFSAAVQVTPAGTPSSVVGRFTFYNQSAYDVITTGTDADDRAIAPDKQALLPGQGPATFANYTTYTKGINGVMVDVLGLPLGTNPTLQDFAFRTGRDAGSGGDDGLVWTDGPTPVTMSIRRGGGVNGSDRISLFWDNFVPTPPNPATQAVRDGWLEVTLKPGARTALARPDVFYFGNLAGDIGDTPPAGATHAVVNALDMAAMRRQASAPASITSPYDFTRDALVNGLDRGVARAALFHSLRLITAPAAAPPADAEGAIDPGMIASAVGAAPALVAAQAKRSSGVWELVAT